MSSGFNDAPLRFLAGFFEDVALTESEFKRERLRQLDQLAKYEGVSKEKLEDSLRLQKDLNQVTRSERKTSLDFRKQLRWERKREKEERRRLKHLKRQERLKEREASVEILAPRYLEEDVLSRSKRAATARPERLWDYGVIPYEIDSNFSGTVSPHALLITLPVGHPFSVNPCIKP